MADAAYRRNDGDRCFHCKDALMDAVGSRWPRPRAPRWCWASTSTTSGDHRPGQRAAAGAGAVFPLVEAGFTKADVRAASRELGLRTWDKPAAACLASRVPYGTPVTLGVLGPGRAGRGRAAAASGSGDLRVRHYGDLARLEVPARRPRPACSTCAPTWSTRCGRPATATSPSTSRACAPGNLNQALAD